MNRLNRRARLTFVVFLIAALYFNYPAFAYGALPPVEGLPGILEIDLPAYLGTNIAVIAGRADGPEVGLKINGRPVKIEPDGRFAAEVLLSQSAGGSLALDISSEAGGKCGTLTREIPCFCPGPVLYFGATERTNEGFAVLSGRVNTLMTSALLAAVVPPLEDAGVLETSFPGRTFFSGAAETVVKSPLGSSWLRFEEDRGESSNQKENGDREPEEQHPLPWKITDTTFHIPFDAGGRFSACLPLYAGPNTILLAAVTPDGQVYSQARQCYYDFPLTVNPLPDQTGRSLLAVSGTTRPGNRVEVNVSFKTGETFWASERYEARVLADGRWYAPVTLHPGENRVSVAVFEEIPLWSGKTGQNIAHREYYVAPQARTVVYLPSGASP